MGDLLAPSLGGFIQFGLGGDGPSGPAWYATSGLAGGVYWLYVSEPGVYRISAPRGAKELTVSRCPDGAVPAYGDGTSNLAAGVYRVALGPVVLCTPFAT